MKVSIITPVYKPTVRDLEITNYSLFTQTNTNFEWVVVADGSYIDDFMEEYLLNKGYTVYAKTADNFGPSVARNIGFQMSSGDIITYLDLGDELNPKRVEHLINMYTNHAIDLLFSGYTLMQDEHTVATVNPSDLITKHFGNVSGYMAYLQKKNTSIPLGVSHTRKPFVKCGGFQRGIVCGEDGILWRRMADKLDLSRIFFDNSIAGIYHISQIGQSRTQRRFDKGGFAFDASNVHGSHGQYLDYGWFKDFNSEELYDK